MLCSGPDLLLNPGRPWAPLAASINIWTVVVGLLALTAAAVIKRVLGAGPAFWTRAAAAIVAATLAMHVIAIASLFWLRLTAPSRRDDAWFMTGLARLRAFEVVALSAVIFVTTVALFRIETFSFMTSYPLLAGFRSPLALTGACALLLAAAGLFRLEAVLERRNPRALARIRSIALLTAAAATCVLYFDFSLSADPQHYLTNVGPAVHLLHGGQLMVDTFSQYGPGPVVATMLGFMIGPISFGTANLTVQFFNLAFYIIFLACLYRMTSRKLAALLLGVFAIGAMFAIWFWGQWSLNAPPSVLGFRYLPCLVMVLALSEMRPPKRWSPLSAFATCFAALWSLETLAGTLGTPFVVFADAESAEGLVFATSDRRSNGDAASGRCNLARCDSNQDLGRKLAGLRPLSAFFCKLQHAGKLFGGSQQTDCFGGGCRCYWPISLSWQAPGCAPLIRTSDCCRSMTPHCSTATFRWPACLWSWVPTMPVELSTSPQ